MSTRQLYLIITIDVEEDQWGFNGGLWEVENIRMLPRLQKLFDRYGIRPTYLVSYPVVSTPWAADILHEVLSRQKCEIGAHLHPWNTPPVTEEINQRNSMLKNLPYELQAAKLTELTEKIAAVFGRRPASFRAGRWALGPDTVKALVACDYLTDCSVTPTISWEQYGGAEYMHTAATEPYWLTLDKSANAPPPSILEVPATIGFNRWPFTLYHRIHSRLQIKWFRYFRPIGFMHYTGILRKIWLSPEISSAADMIQLSRLMLENGMLFFNMSFHSTTLLPGKTPFVKDARELDHFYGRIEDLLEYLSTVAEVLPLTLSEIRKRMNGTQLLSGACNPPNRPTCLQPGV